MNEIEENVETVVFCGLSESAYKNYMASNALPLSESTYASMPHIIRQVFEGYEIPNDLHENLMTDLFPVWGDRGVNASFFYDDAEAFGEYVVEARINGDEWEDYVVLPGGLVLVRDPSVMEVLDVYKDRIKGKIMSVLRENTQDTGCFGRYSNIAEPAPFTIDKADEILLENVREKVLTTLTEEKILREVTDDELSILQDILDDLDGQDLAFDKLFDGKMRAVLDFKTMDEDTELYKLAEILREQVSVNVDWETGMVSASREITDWANQTEELVNMLMNRGEPKPKKVKKFQMKINKYFAKVEEVYRKYYAARMKIIRSKHGDSSLHSTPGIHLSTGDIEKHTTPEELVNYHRIMQSMELYTGTSSMNHFVYKAMNTKERTEEDDMTIFPQWAIWWRDNAGYVKKNYKDLFQDKYAMIASRHPIDILRMSDFEEIYSCHSPPSHDHHDSSHYRCAVAEAHGHGAVVYVVSKEDLLHATNTSNLDSAEQEIQEGEIFKDSQRIHDPVYNMEPVSRIRLRQVKFYQPDDALNSSIGMGTELAVPERRVYGAKMPGIRNRVLSWVKEAYAEDMKNLPMKDGAVDMSRFIKLGGSYEDNGINSLIAAMLPDGTDIVGRPIQDSDTEDRLPDDLGGDAVAALENEISDLEDRWQSTYANIGMDVRVEDDHGGGAYVVIDADYIVDIPMSNGIEAVPGYQHVEWLASHLNEMDWSGANSRQYERYGSSYGTPRNIQHIDTFTGHGSFHTVGGGTQMSLKVSLNLNMEAFDDNGNGWFSTADGFDEACILINEFDDKSDAIEAEIMRYLKREGFAAGGAYMQLAREIDDGDVSSYEWDVETDGEYEDSYESYAQYSHHYDYETGPFKSNPEVLEKLLNSREYRVLLRQYILAEPKSEIGTEYNLTIDNANTQVVGNYVRHYIRFKITADDPSESVELFKELVTGEMDDEENLNVVHNKALANIMQQSQSGQWGDDVQERLIKESKDETTRHVNRWREFIRSK
tara:strand:+ start:4668 stop:7652 length:2985 start_codon:yes stop_codon:yes gene_type:complete